MRPVKSIHIVSTDPPTRYVGMQYGTYAEANELLREIGAGDSPVRLDIEVKWSEAQGGAVAIRVIPGLPIGENPIGERLLFMLHTMVEPPEFAADVAFTDLPIGGGTPARSTALCAKGSALIGAKTVRISRCSIALGMWQEGMHMEALDVVCDQGCPDEDLIGFIFSAAGEDEADPEVLAAMIRYAFDAGEERARHQHAAEFGTTLS